MEEKYKNYVIAFNKLEKENKKKLILENLEELTKLFYKINSDFNYYTKPLPIFKDINNNDDEYLTELFSYILTLKEYSAKTIEILLKNAYEEIE